MSNEVTIDDLAGILKENKKAVLDEISSLRKEVKEITTSHNTSITKIALLERDVSSNTTDIDKNWVVTRKLDSKITKWGGVIGGLSIASGFVIKFAF